MLAGGEVAEWKAQHDLKSALLQDLQFIVYTKMMPCSEQARGLKFLRWPHCLAQPVRSSNVRYTTTSNSSIPSTQFRKGRAFGTTIVSWGLTRWFAGRQSVNRLQPSLDQPDPSPSLLTGPLLQGPQRAKHWRYCARETETGSSVNTDSAMVVWNLVQKFKAVEY